MSEIATYQLLYCFLKRPRFRLRRPHGLILVHPSLTIPPPKWPKDSTWLWLISTPCIARHCDTATKQFEEELIDFLYPFEIQKITILNNKPFRLNIKVQRRCQNLQGPKTWLDSHLRNSSGSWLCLYTYFCSAAWGHAVLGSDYKINSFGRVYLWNQTGCLPRLLGPCLV